MKRHQNQCPLCNKYTNRGLTIDAIIEKEGEILLIKRGNKPFKGMWALPGGFVGWNETVEEALIRETKEETNLTVTSYKLIGVYSKPQRHPQQVINIAFAAKTRGKVHVGDDALELKFFPINKIPQKLAYDHKQIINDFLSPIYPY